MFFLFLAILCVMLPVSPVGAAEIFIQKDTGKVDIKPENEPPETPADINDFANTYYENCMKTRHPVIMGEHLQMMCACTASKIPDVMTVQQMQALQTDTDEGQFQRNRMMMFVYAPCIEYPTRALVEDSCMSNPQVKTAIRHYPKVCKCLGDHMAETMARQAPNAIEKAIKRNPKDLDPLGVLVNSKNFELHSRSHMKECLLRYELGRLQ